MDSNEQNFEEMLASLEDIVQKMENQEMSLDEQLQNFSKGINLVSSCEKKLQVAESQVKILLNKDNNPDNDTISNFTPKNDSDEFAS
jgi:exodeoxyribonuclease VII small subunit